MKTVLIPDPKEEFTTTNGGHSDTVHLKIFFLHGWRFLSSPTPSRGSKFSPVKENLKSEWTDEDGAKVAGIRWFVCWTTPPHPHEKRCLPGERWRIEKDNFKMEIMKLEKGWKPQGELLLRTVKSATNKTTTWIYTEKVRLAAFL